MFSKKYYGNKKKNSSKTKRKRLIFRIDLAEVNPKLPCSNFAVRYHTPLLADSRSSSSIPNPPADLRVACGSLTLSFSSHIPLFLISQSINLSPLWYPNFVAHQCFSLCHIVYLNLSAFCLSFRGILLFCFVFPFLI